MGRGDMWVKICGTTNLADALLAVDAGADAVGFVFGPSPRQVTPEQVAAITRQLPENVDRIGVFVNESPGRIADIVRTAGLTGVQLQGDESPESIGVLRRSSLRLLIRTVWASAGIDTLAERVAAGQNETDAILLDSGGIAARGGRAAVRLEGCRRSTLEDRRRPPRHRRWRTQPGQRRNRRRHAASVGCRRVHRCGARARNEGSRSGAGICCRGERRCQAMRIGSPGAELFMRRDPKCPHQLREVRSLLVAAAG
jgi:hypothetical protein